MSYTTQNIRFHINKNFGWVKNLPKKVFIVDNEYQALSRTFVLNKIKNDKWLEREKSYKPEVFDCDDYVMHLKIQIAQMFALNNKQIPGALGFIITTRHAFNFSISAQGQVTIFDTVNKRAESNAVNFQAFLEVNPGNIVKLIYI